MTLRRRADSIAIEHLWLWSSVMYLLDTNVVSELRRPRPHGAALVDHAGAVRPATGFFAPPVCHRFYSPRKIRRTLCRKQFLQEGPQAMPAAP